MNPGRRPPLIAIAVVIYCGWQSSDLVGAWRAAPFDRLGWLAFILWLLPLIGLLVWPKVRPATSPGNSVLLWSALVGSLLGTLGAVNALRYAGLACALGSLGPWNWIKFPWLLASISWMPAFGYGVSQLSPNLVLPARLSLAAAAAGWIFVSTSRAAKKSS